MIVLALGGAIGQIRLPKDPHIESQRPEGHTQSCFKYKNPACDFLSSLQPCPMSKKVRTGIGR